MISPKGRTVQYNRDLGYKMELDETGDRRHTYPYDFKLCHIREISACATTKSICFTFFVFSPWSLINIVKRYRTKGKTPTREENCWCLQDRSWTAVRAVALPLLMLFPRLTPPCKPQLWAGGSACSCVGEWLRFLSSAFFHVQLKT